MKKITYKPQRIGPTQPATEEECKAALLDAMEPPPPTTYQEWGNAFKASEDVIVEAQSSMTLKHFMTLSPESRMDVLAILRELKATYALVDRLEREMADECDHRGD